MYLEGLDLMGDQVGQEIRVDLETVHYQVDRVLQVDLGFQAKTGSLVYSKW